MIHATLWMRVVHSAAFSAEIEIHTLHMICIHVYVTYVRRVISTSAPAIHILQLKFL